MLIAFRIQVTPKLDGDVYYGERLIGRVRRVNKKGRRPWECVDVLHAGANGCELFIMECDTQREGIIRLLLHHGLIPA